MTERMLQHYFQRESAEGDLSPEQWETLLDRVRGTKQKRFSWDPFTWFAARLAATDHKGHLQPSVDSLSETRTRSWSSWQRLVPTSRVGWAVVGLFLIATLGAVGYAITPTLGEKLFSQVMGRWDQDYKAVLSEEIGMSETIEGITVTVDRAHFERNRIGIEYTVTGLSQSDPSETSVFAVLEDANAPGVRFRSAGGSGVRADSQIEGMEVPPDTVKEVVAFDVTGAQADASGMRLSFVVSVDEMARGGGENDGSVPVRTIGPFVFNFEVPFIPSTDITVIRVGSTVEVSGVPVRLEEVTITLAEVTALIVVDRTPEQRQANVRPSDVMLNVPGEWPADTPLPHAYIVTTLGDFKDTFLARFHRNWDIEPGEWKLAVENLQGSDYFEVTGPWDFRFLVPNEGYVSELPPAIPGSAGVDPGKPRVDGIPGTPGAAGRPAPRYFGDVWQIDKSLILPGEPIEYSLALRNTWDRRIEFSDFPETVTLIRLDIDTGGEEPIRVRLERSQNATNILATGEELTAVVNISPAISAGLEPGRYGILVDNVSFVRDRGTPAEGETTIGFGGPTFVVVPPEGALDTTVVVDETRGAEGVRLTLEKIHFSPEQTTVFVFVHQSHTGPDQSRPDSGPMTAPTPTGQPSEASTPTPATAPAVGRAPDLTAGYRINEGPWRQLTGRSYRTSHEGVYFEWRLGPVSVNAEKFAFAVAFDAHAGTEPTPIWEWVVPLQDQ